MTPYLVALLGSFSALSLCLRSSLRTQRVAVKALLCGLIGFAAMRGLVGTDTYAYHLMFADNHGESLPLLLQVSEPAFASLIYMVGHFTAEPTLFMLVVALLQGSMLWMLVSRLRHPVLFLLVYVPLFFLNLHFNIVRTGIALLLVLLALQTDMARRKHPSFYLYCLVAPLFHYSAVVAVVPLLLTRVRWRDRFSLLLSVSAGVAIAGLIWLVALDTIIEKSLIYRDLIAPGTTGGVSWSFVLGVPLYLAMYVCALKRSNAVGLTLLLVTWLVLRWLTVDYTLVGRVEIFFNALLLFYVSQLDLSGRRRTVRTWCIAALAIMWTAASLLGLAHESGTLDRLGIVDEIYLSSPFVPYRFFWETQ